MLEETLVIWGGEFGRTIYSQGGLTPTNYGRDHHPRCFTMWMAGGGTRPGAIYGTTDDFSYNIVENPVSVHDFHATVLHLLGFDHQRFSIRYQGLDQRLTGVEPAASFPNCWREKACLALSRGMSNANPADAERLTEPFESRN